MTNRLRTRRSTAPTAAASLICTALPALFLLQAGPGFLVPSAVAADSGSDAAVSATAGVPLPKNATHLTQGDVTGGFGRLLAALAGEWEIPAGGNTSAEVQVWSGDAYKPGRAAFSRAAFGAALRAAGYTYEEVNRQEITTNPFDTDFGLSATDEDTRGRPIRLSPWDSFTYFRATNPQKKITVVGFWADQENDKQLVLALSRTGFKPKPGEAPLPDAPTGPDIVLVKDFDHPLKGVPGIKPPAFRKIAPRPRTVRGLILDEGGKPIVGARIVVEASAAGGIRTDVRARSNAQGIYEVPLPVGVCQVVNADCKVSYGGREYLLSLSPADGECDYFNSREGHVENFVLSTTGAAGAGDVRVLWWDLPDGKGTLEVTLKPQGPLLGGGRGKTLIYRFANKGTSEKFLKNVPIGRYTLTARFLEGGEELPLRARKTFGDSDELFDSLPIEFEAEGGDLASLDRSNVKRFDVTLKP